MIGDAGFVHRSSRQPVIGRLARLGDRHFRFLSRGVGRSEPRTSELADGVIAALREAVRPLGGRNWNGYAEAPEMSRTISYYDK